MVKVRMNTADVAAEVKCLRRLIGMRCSNVYDISPKTYMFKLMKSSGVTESGESEKILLLVESGVRLHATAFVRDKSTTPSGFTLKLRKHIRTRRLEDVRQLGIDRVVDFQFGLGMNAHHIILELYAQGNILLTDSDYNILTLLRTHRDDEKGITMMAHHCYPIDACRVFKRTSLEKLQLLLSSSAKSEAQDKGVEGESHRLTKSYAKQLAGTDNEKLSQKTSNEKLSHKSSNEKLSHKPSNEKLSQKTSQRSGSDKWVSDGGMVKKHTLKTLLSESLGYGPALSEHIILDAGLQPNKKFGSESEATVDNDTLQALASAFARFEDWLQEVSGGSSVPEGYIVMQKKMLGKKEGLPFEEREHEEVYDEFSPLLLHQFKLRNFTKMETFDESMDEFFSKIESQRAEQQQRAQEGSAMQKLSKIRLDQENRVQALKKEADHSVCMAELIEYNLEDVDGAILAVRAALASGMDWKDLARMVKEEKKAGNPVAGLIHSLKLETNCITLLLSNNLDDMDEDEKTQPADMVEVDLALSAHANARRWFEAKKKQASKQEKTVIAHEKAFKAAEKKTQRQLAQAKTVAAISHIRKVHWFEKFNWFISGENYLVISGRDAQQNELIVKRYMRKGDLYVHADLHGASSTVIKNHNPDHPIPPLTLNQAGCFTVCHSQAWDSKIITSAWWVYSHQVSKTAPTGEYLTVGSFMVRGKKNFLPPHPLVMGFGLLFVLEESSLGSHLNERRVRCEDEDQESDREEREICETPTQLGSGDESSSEEKGIPDEEMNGDSTANVKVGKAENCAQNGEVNKVSIFSDTCEGNNMPMPLTEGHHYAVSQENTFFHSADDKNASVNSKVENEIYQSQSKLEELMDKALELGSVKMSGKDQSNKYGLEIYQEAEVTESINYADNPNKPGQREKPYLSKAERRKLKKGSKDNAESRSEQELHEKSSENVILSERSRQGEVITGDEKSDMTASTGKVSRGRKGKLKKIKEKYAEQDEEERKIRMALLASSGKGSKEARETRRQKEDLATAKMVESTTGEAGFTKVCYKCKRPGHVARDCPEHIEETNEDIMNLSQSVSADMIQDDAESHSVKNKLTESDRLALLEDDIHELAEDEKEKLTELDFLTGSPLPSDILLYAVPVCGPYNALQAYKYHVKITPGMAKKGKAAKTAMNLFTHMQDATIREKELMRALTEPELIAAMIGNAKITAPGLTQLKQRQKKGKKSNASK